MVAAARRWSGCALLLFAFAVCLPDARGQAWLPAKGTTTVSLSYQYALIKEHYLSRGERIDIGHIHSQFNFLEVYHSPTDHLMFGAGIPYVMAKYSGPRPHQLPIDGGRYHSSWQDWRLDARYQLVRGPIALTPFVGVVLPSHNYTYFAHSAVGRRLREVVTGFYAGRTFEVLPNSYMQSRLSYSFVEHKLGHRIDHANADLDMGYFVTERFGVRALASYNRTIGGIDFDRIVPGSIEFLNHDQLLSERHFNLGAGANYALSDSVDVYSSALHTRSGRNGHKLHVAVTAGISWTFDRGARWHAETRAARQTSSGGR